MNLIENQLKPFKNNLYSNYYKSLLQSTGKLRQTNTHCRIIQEARARKLALKSKKICLWLRILLGGDYERRPQSEQWKTAYLGQINTIKQSLTSLKNSPLPTPQYQIVSFWEKNPTVLQKENLSSSLSLIGAFLSSTTSE